METVTETITEDNSKETITEDVSGGRWNYHVFLSSVGNNAPHGSGYKFTDQLSNMLQEAGFELFRDDDARKRGDEISWEMNVEGIKKSLICVIIFTHEYGGSKWCLDVVEKMINYMEDIKVPIVIPVFMDYIDVSAVNEVTCLFWKNFQKAVRDVDFNKTKSDRWRDALRKASLLPSTIKRKTWNEIEFLKDICDAVKVNVDKVNNMEPLQVVEHRVGINAQIENICALLNLTSNSVLIIGIFGKKGSGKTMLAKSVYNKLFPTFEFFCFLSKDNNKSEQDPSGLALLHGILPSILSNKTDEYAGNGRREIKEIYRCRKALIVIDNIESSNELVEGVAKLRMHLSPGSRIIVTAREEDFLDEVDIDIKYGVKELDVIESLKLFNLHAFGNTESTKGFEDLSFSFVQRAKRVPSVIVGLGSYLSGKSILEWNAHLKALLISDNATLHVPAEPNALDDKKDVTPSKLKGFAQVGEQGCSSNPSPVQTNIPEANTESKKFYMIGARELEISDSDDPKKWKWTYLNYPSSVEVAELLSAKSLEIQCKVKTRMLSSWTNYGAFLVYKYGDSISELLSAEATTRIIDKNNNVAYDEATRIMFGSMNESSVRNEEGWKEIKLGQFIIYDENDHTVEMRLMQTSEVDKCGLIIQGIEFRPKGFEVPSKEFSYEVREDKVSKSYSDSRPSPEVSRLFSPIFWNSSRTSIEEDDSTPSSPVSRCAVCKRESVEENVTRCGLVLEFCKECLHKEIRLENKCPGTTCEEIFNVKHILRIYV